MEDLERLESARKDIAENIIADYDFGIPVKDYASWTHVKDILSTVVFTEDNEKAQFAVRFENNSYVPVDVSCSLNGEIIGYTGRDLKNYADTIGNNLSMGM